MLVSQAFKLCDDSQPETAGKRVSSVVQALQVLYSEREVGGEVGLPRHWMRDFFLASLCLEVQENQEALSRLQVCLYLHLVPTAVSCLPATSYLGLLPQTCMYSFLSAWLCPGGS